MDGLRCIEVPAAACVPKNHGMTGGRGCCRRSGLRDLHGISTKCVMPQHYAMLQRNLLYTGLTRGKRLVVLVGQKKAVAIAVRNVSGRRHWSKLSEWLNPQRVLAGV